VLLIGYDHTSNQYSALGIKENEIGKNTDEHHVYHIKQLRSQNQYLKIINSKPGSIVEMPSDISGSFWANRNFTVIEPTPNIIGKLSYFEVYHHIQKLPDGSFLKHSHSKLHRRTQFNNYQL
jgi:hypothetical protein